MGKLPEESEENEQTTQAVASILDGKYPRLAGAGGDEPDQPDEYGEPLQVVRDQIGRLDSKLRDFMLLDPTAPESVVRALFAEAADEWAQLADAFAEAFPGEKEAEDE